MSGLDGVGQNDHKVFQAGEGSRSPHTEHSGSLPEPSRTSHRGFETRGNIHKEKKETTSSHTLSVFQLLTRNYRRVRSGWWTEDHYVP